MDGFSVCLVCSNRGWVAVLGAKVRKAGYRGVLGLVDREDGVAVGGYSGNILRLAWLWWLLLSECFFCRWC